MHNMSGDENNVNIKATIADVPYNTIIRINTLRLKSKYSVI